MKNPEESTKKTILVKTLTDVLPNLVVFGIGLIIIVALGNAFPWVGVLGLIVYIIILIFDFVTIATIIFTTAILLFATKGDKAPLKENVMDVIIATVRILETSVFFIYTLILFQKFSPF